MNVLIAYATYSGGTETAAHIVEETLKGKSHTVTMKNPKDVSPGDVNTADLTVLCTPTWDFEGAEGQPHEDYNQMRENFKNSKLDGKKFSILSLGDSSYAKFCGSADVLEDFVKTAGAVLAVPSLKIDGFFYDQNTHTETIKKWADSLG